MSLLQTSYSSDSSSSLSLCRSSMLIDERVAEFDFYDDFHFGSFKHRHGNTNLDLFKMSGMDLASMKSGLNTDITAGHRFLAFMAGSRSRERQSSCAQRTSIGGIYGKTSEIGNIPTEKAFNFIDNVFNGCSDETEGRIGWFSRASASRAEGYEYRKELKVLTDHKIYLKNCLEKDSLYILKCTDEVEDLLEGDYSVSGLQENIRQMKVHLHTVMAEMEREMEDVQRQINNLTPSVYRT